MTVPSAVTMVISAISLLLSVQLPPWASSSIRLLVDEGVMLTTKVVLTVLPLVGAFVDVASEAATIFGGGVGLSSATQEGCPGKGPPEMEMASLDLSTENGFGSVMFVP